MLKSIVIVTISVANLTAVSDAWNKWLGYEQVGSGVVSEQAGEIWGAPATEGRAFVLMRAESGDPTLVRFIDADVMPGYAPNTSWGWNATELLALDPDAMASRLKESPFEIVGPPADLWNAPNAPRAMQVIGPGQELIYLTRNQDFSIKTAVDRVFIMVVGGPSMTAFRDFYGDRLGLSVGDATPFRISVISNAMGLPPETTFPLAIATISSRFLIELDEYPASAQRRERQAGMLPPGVAMVAFSVDDLDALDVDWRGTPATLSDAPYAGRRVGVTTGPAGEWIELIEMPGDALNAE